VRAGASPVVSAEDIEAVRRRRPAPALVLHEVADCGHSVQSDKPVELAALWRALLGVLAAN